MLEQPLVTLDPSLESDRGMLHNDVLHYRGQAGTDRNDALHTYSYES